MKLSAFFKSFFLSFNPDKYRVLTTKSVRESFGYLIGMIIFSIFISIIILLPLIFSTPNMIQKELTKFDHITIAADAPMKESAHYPLNRPWITVTQEPSYKEQGEKIILTNTTLTINGIKEKQIVFEDYNNLAQKGEDVQKVINILFWLILPTLILMWFLFLLIVYFIIIGLIALIGSIIVFFIRLNLNFQQILKISVYASTIMITAEAIFIPLRIKTYFIPAILFIVYFVLAIIATGERNEAGIKTTKKVKVK